MVKSIPEMIADFVYGAITDYYQEENFFSIDGDIIYDPVANEIKVLMENGKKYIIKVEEDSKYNVY